MEAGFGLWTLKGTGCRVVKGGLKGLVFYGCRALGLLASFLRIGFRGIVDL